MVKSLPQYIEYSLKDLKTSIKRDSYNLTRDDHDAILHQIDNLAQFIKERYENHGDECSNQCG